MKNAAASVLLVLLVVLAGCGGGGNSGGTSHITGSGGPLIITTSSLPDGLSGKPYSASLGVSGGNGRLTWSINSAFFPSGLTLDAASGSLSGTVSNAVLGDVTFKVTDSSSPQQVALKTIRMTFDWAMAVTTYPLTTPAGHTGVPYKLALVAGSANGNVTWSLTSGQAPPGMSLTNLSAPEADLVGTPTQAGTFAFVAQATDSSTPPQTATANVSVTVDNKLGVATVNLPVPYAYEPYNQTITAVNGTPPYHWAWGLYYPSGLSIDPTTGVISGIPGQGNYAMSVVVTDSASPANTGEQTYSMLILPRLKVTSATLYDAHATQSYSATLYRDGGQGNVVWSVASGLLPPGLTLQPQYGTISGIPTQLGTYTFTAQVQDSSTPPQTAQGQVTLTVKAAVLSLQPSLPSRIPVNVSFDGAAATTGGTPPFTFSLNAGTLPTGLNLDTSTGAITGTPTATGYYGFNIRVTDSSTPQQTAAYGYPMTVGAALGRNDTVGNATKLNNGGYSASISPLLDPPTATVLSPDTDYYRITALGGATVKVNVNGYSQYGSPGAIDPVLELVDANGARLSACRLPGDTTSNFNSSCLNDDIVKGSNLNSQLEYLVPGTPDTKVDVFAHVFDWRGDARPDMTYSINVTGAFVPIVFQTVSPLPDAAVNASCSVGLAAQGGTGVLTGTVSAGSLPPGATLDQFSTTNSDSSGSWSGRLAGGFTTPGEYTFTISIKDTASPSQTSSQQFTMTVYPALTLSPIPDQTLTVGQTTTYQPSISGGIGPFNWFYAAAVPWITIDKNTGLLTFKPTTAGQYSFQVWVSGTSAACGGTLWTNQTFNVTVK
jgi:hypothetical protein